VEGCAACYRRRHRRNVDSYFAVVVGGISVLGGTADAPMRDESLRVLLGMELCGWLVVLANVHLDMLGSSRVSKLTLKGCPVSQPFQHPNERRKP
jgi:hypothetical protein